MQSADVRYRPDYATPPGETLRETLEALGMTQADLSRRTGLSTKHINQIIQGAAPISPDTALALERVVGVPARLWNALEANYQSQQLRLQSQTVSEEDAVWLRQPAIKELTRTGLLAKSATLAELRDQVLSFFGVASREAWEAVWLAPEASFRRSPAFEADQMATAAWLRIGEVEATNVKTEPFDRVRLQAALSAIRALMVRDPKEFDPEMRRLLAESGVALVTVPEVKGCRAHGAARWLSPTKALIQLSVRYKWEDVFWFSLFHEAGHVLLHGKRSIFIEAAGDGSSEEEEANRFAAQLLIPPIYDNELLRIRDVTGALALARKLEIPPGVVIGRLQKEKLLGYNVGHDYRRKFDLVPLEATP